MSPVPVLGPRALGRALLARQHLLARTGAPALDVIEHLVGMQAQAPLAAYVGLWSRVDGFAAGELAELMTARRVVRASLMRATIHLVSDRDCLAIRPLVKPVLATGLAGHFHRVLDGVDVEAVVATGRELLTAQPRTRAQLRDLLGARWPQWDADGLAYAVSYLVPTVQVTRGVGFHRARGADHGGVLARPAAGGRPVDRRAGAPVPGRVRAGRGAGRAGVVGADQAP